MQPAENKKIPKKMNGVTEDIVQQVMSTFRKDYRQCADVANELKGENVFETCKNIFDYIIKNVEYVPDPKGNQWIRTPARLLADGQGDCKSMSIFAASCLRCLNIDAYFRFVSFAKNKIPTHVYVVTLDGTIIDPVERVEGKPKFNYAQNYTFKIDIMNTTNIYELRGIGAPQDVYDVWTGDRSFLENTVAENYLYSEIECCLSYLSVEPTPEMFNNCDTAVAALTLFQNGCDNEAGGHLLQFLADKGMFENQSIDEVERIQHLDDINFALNEVMQLDVKPQNNGTHYNWYLTNVLKYNTKEGRNKEGISEYIAKVKESNTEIGATSQQIQNALVAELQKSGWGFCYILTTSAWFKANAANLPEMQRKYANEQSLFNQWSVALKKYFNEANIKNYMRTGFIKQTGQTPEAYISAGIKAGGVPSAPNIGVALTSAAIVAIVTAVLAVVQTIIQLIIVLIQKSMSNPNNFPNDVPPGNGDYLGAADLEKLNKGSSSNKSSSNNNILLLALAAGAFFLFKK